MSSNGISPYIYSLSYSPSLPLSFLNSSRTSLMPFSHMQTMYSAMKPRLKRTPRAMAGAQMISPRLLRN